MKLAYSSNAYMKVSIDEAVRRVAGLGFAGVELMADVPHAWPATTSDEQIAGIRDALTQAQLAISNVNAFMMNAVQDFWHPSWIEPDTGYRRQRVEHTKAALTMAAKLGAPSITTEPGGPLPDGMSRDQAMDIFVDGLCEVLPRAEAEGVQLLVEPEPELLIETADQFLELAARIDSPAFGLNFDVGHFYCVGEPLPETVRRLAPLTRHYHLEDIAATRVHEHLIPGRGAIDFASVLDAVRETGYDGWLTVELYPYLDDPDGAGREARRWLEPLLTDA
ncbi:MAG: sugar phosphate isomerase/epimerase [Planctomycetes bacterium]|nr:sugar phosphate isomerase/epimerase [Planctomycetota bacterium]